MLGFSELVQWLWSRLIQQELDELKNGFNDHLVRYDRKKVNPSGTTPNLAYSLYNSKKFRGQWCLQNVDVGVVQGLMDKLGGRELVEFVSPEYAVRAEEAFSSLNIVKLTFQNVWAVFSAMRPLM